MFIRVSKIWLAISPRCDGSMETIDDTVIFGVLNELDFHGQRAGHDLAVVGFDDVVAAARSSPPLTMCRSTKNRLVRY